MLGTRRHRTQTALERPAAAPQAWRLWSPWSRQDRGVGDCWRSPGRRCAAPWPPTRNRPRTAAASHQCNGPPALQSDRRAIKSSARQEMGVHAIRRPASTISGAPNRVSRQPVLLHGRLPQRARGANRSFAHATYIALARRDMPTGTGVTQRERCPGPASVMLPSGTPHPFSRGDRAHQVRNVRFWHKYTPNLSTKLLIADAGAFLPACTGQLGQQATYTGLSPARAPSSICGLWHRPYTEQWRSCRRPRLRVARRAQPRFTGSKLDTAVMPRAIAPSTAPPATRL